MFFMPSPGVRLALMRVSAGRSDAFRAAPSNPRGAELKQCATAFPRLGLRRLSVGALPPGAACGEQDPESRPTVSPALLAIAFHRSDPDLAANFGGKLVGLCVRTLRAPPLPVPR